MARCRECGHENRPEHNFCTQCGSKLNGDTQRIGQLIVMSEPIDIERGHRRRGGFTPYQEVDRRQGYRFAGRTIFIGRDASNDIVVEDGLASARHSRITQSEEAFFIEDLGSTNGTFVEGERIGQKVRLQDGVLVKIGTTIFKFKEQLE